MEHFLPKIYNKHSSQLKELGNSANEYGKSISDYLTGVQEMYRASFENASEMSANTKNDYHGMS